MVKKSCCSDTCEAGWCIWTQNYCIRSII